MSNGVFTFDALQGWPRARTGGEWRQDNDALPDYFVACVLAFHDLRTVRDIHATLAQVLKEPHLPRSCVEKALKTAVLRGRVCVTIAQDCHQGHLHLHYCLTLRGLHWVDWWYRVLHGMCSGQDVLAEDERGCVEALTALHERHPHLRMKTYGLSPRRLSRFFLYQHSCD